MSVQDRELVELFEELKALRDTSTAEAVVATDAGNRGQADYETGRAHAYAHAARALGRYLDDHYIGMEE